jgi:hypothetical protein
VTGGEIIRQTLVSGSPLPTAAGERVRPNAVQTDDPAPYIAFIRSSNDRELGLDGTLLAKTETFQIFCWAETPEEAQALEEQVVPLLIEAGFAMLPNEPDGAAADVGDNCAVLTVAYIHTPVLP